MTQAERAKELYDKLQSMAAVAREMNISRQRAHQLITGYRTLKSTARKKTIEYFRSLGIVLCKDCEKEPFTVIHHKNGNSRNNKIENLIHLCYKCHIQRHSWLSAK